MPPGRDLDILIADLRQRVDSLEQKDVLLEAQLVLLEKKVAEIGPCPPPTDPDPPDPELELSGSPLALAFVGDSDDVLAPGEVSLSGDTALNTPVITSISDPGSALLSAVITQTGPGAWTLTVTPKTGLVAGAYAAVITVASSNQTNVPLTISVDLTITEDLVLLLSSSNISVVTDEGLDAPPANISLVEGGTGVLQTPVAGTPSATWISSVAITGSVPLWNAQLTFNTDALLPGLHNATVQFTSPNATNNPRILNVALTVVDVVDPPPPNPDPNDPELESDPDSLTFNSVEAGPAAAAQSIYLYRVGTQPLAAPTITGTSDPDSIIASAIITAIDGDEWNLVVTPNNKAAGTYLATITVESVDQTNPPIIIPVTLVVQAATIPLTFSLSQSVLNRGVLEGLNLTPSNIVITGAGTGTLNAPTASSLPAWVTAVNISGAHPTWQAQVVYDTTGLVAGNYSDVIDFSSTNGTNNPVQLTINVTVSPNVPVPPPTSTYKGATLPVGDQQIVFNAATRRFDNTVMITTGFSFAGTVHTPAAGDSTALQAALNAAVAGDVIQLVPGSTYIGSFTLPAGKAGYVKIRSGTLAGLPSSGTRVFPSDIGNMAIIQGLNTVNTNTLKVGQAAQYYYFEGVCVRQNPAGTVVNQSSVINLNSPTITQESDYARRFIFDRCLVLGATNQDIRRTFRADARFVAWIDSYVGDTRDSGADAQAIYSNSGGPFKIINTYLAASGECILTGSAQTAYAGAHVHDLEIRQSEFSKPASWIGQPWYHNKNCFESKGVKRALFEGVLFQRNPSGAQTGFCFLLTNYDHSGRDEDNVDIVVFGARVRDVGAGFNQLNSNARVGAHGRVVFDQIVMERIGQTPYSGDKRLFQVLRGTGKSQIEKVTIHNVTGYVPSGLSVFASIDGQEPEMSNLEWKNCILSHGTYGYFLSGFGVGTPALNASCAVYAFTKNVLTGGSGTYPAGNAINIAPTVVMTDPANGDYTVKVGSGYENWGDDGEDPGADIALVTALTNGCETGVWP